MLLTSNTIRRLSSFLVYNSYPFSRSFLRPRLCATFSSSSLQESGDLGNAAWQSAAATNSKEIGLYRLLTPKERGLLSEQKKLTATCRSIALRVLEETSEEHQTILKQLDSNFLNLESSFSVVVAGEFNAGKSTLINALLGQKLLESGALPTTDSITIVSSSKNDDTTPLPLGLVWHTVPDVPVLEDLTLIDTPGTNSTWLDHTERTLRLLPAADMILFVTSADRPFSESERTLLKGIQAYRKSIVVVVNKIDVLDADGGDHGKEAKQAVVDFVMDRSSELLGARPIVIPLSARDALSAKLLERNNDVQRSNVWHRSQFGALETFLKDSLTTQAKLQSKLTSPIGVVEGVMRECLHILENQSQDLQTDIATLNVLQAQFGGWKKELATELQGFQQATKELVRNQGQRWKILLQRMNMWSFHYNVLVDKSKFDQEWEETKLQLSVHGGKSLQEDILAHVEEIADSVATRGRAQGQAVIEYLGKRPAMQNQSLVGSVTAASRFEDTRHYLSTRLSSAVKTTLRTDEEAKEKDEVFHFLWNTAVLSVGLQTCALAAAIGTFVELLQPITGMAVASSLAVGGGSCYAVGTTRIAHVYDTKWLRKSKDLGEALVSISDKEFDRVCGRILDGVGPYTRFVGNEKERIANLKEECEGVCAASRNLRNRINKLQ